MTICLESNWFSRKQVLHNLAQNYRGNSAEIRGDRCHICISLYFAKPLVQHSAANFGRTVSSRINHRFISKWDALKQFSHGLWTKLYFLWGFDWYFHGIKSLLFTHYHTNIPFILTTSFLVFTTTVSDARANNKSSSLTYAVNVHLKTCKKVTVISFLGAFLSEVETSTFFFLSPFLCLELVLILSHVQWLVKED